MNRKPIPGYPGYEVSDDGRVWSCKKQRMLGGGRGSETYLSEEFIELRCRHDIDGYRRVAINASGKKYSRKVSILVLQAFVGHKPEKHYQASHDNGIRDDDRLENLAWKTPKENIRDKIRHGTMPFGDKSPNAKLTSDKVKYIRFLLSQGKPQRSVASMYGVSQSTVGAIALGKTWPGVEFSFEKGSRYV